MLMAVPFSMAATFSVWSPILVVDIIFCSLEQVWLKLIVRIYELHCISGNLFKIVKGDKTFFCVSAVDCLCCFSCKVATDSFSKAQGSLNEEILWN